MQVGVDPDIVLKKFFAAVLVCMVWLPASAQSPSTPAGTVSSASPALKMHVHPTKIGVPVTHVDVAPMNPLETVSRYPALFMWTERPTRIEMHVDYSGADAQLHTITGEISVQTVASLILLVLGAWVGAGLLAVFSLVYARQRGNNAAEASASHALRLFLAGGVTGTIFILLVQRIGDLDLPFKFAVNDMIGGVIVGLLSFKLGDTLYKYFFVSKP